MYPRNERDRVNKPYLPPRSVNQTSAPQPRTATPIEVPKPGGAGEHEPWHESRGRKVNNNDEFRNRSGGIHKSRQGGSGGGAFGSFIKAHKLPPSASGSGHNNRPDGSSSQSFSSQQKWGESESFSRSSYAGGSGGGGRGQPGPDVTKRLRGEPERRHMMENMDGGAEYPSIGQTSPHFSRLPNASSNSFGNEPGENGGGSTIADKSNNVDAVETARRNLMEMNKLSDAEKKASREAQRKKEKEKEARRNEQEQTEKLARQEAEARRIMDQSQKKKAHQTKISTDFSLMPKNFYKDRAKNSPHAKAKPYGVVDRMQKKATLKPVKTDATNVESSADDLSSEDDRPSSSSKKRSACDDRSDGKVKESKKTKQVKKGKMKETEVLEIDSSPEKSSRKDFPQKSKDSASREMEALIKERNLARKLKKQQEDDIANGLKPSEEYDPTLDLDDDSDASGGQGSEEDWGEEQAQESKNELDLEMDLLLGGREATPDAILHHVGSSPPPMDIPLCPFCSAPLPDSPSSRLEELKDYLLSRPNIRPNPTRRNPDGMRLPVTETASFCRRHVEERETIPHGKEMGWPTRMDWKAFTETVQATGMFWLLEFIVNSTKSQFLDDALKEWEEKGARKMANIMNEWGTIDLELPGYYGPRGLEIILEAINDQLVKPDQVKPGPLPLQHYIRRVLVPELSWRLIQKDNIPSGRKIAYSSQPQGTSGDPMVIDDEDDEDEDPNRQLTEEEAKLVLIASRPYGRAMFAVSEEEEKWKHEEERREAREVARANEAQNAKEHKERQEKRLRQQKLELVEINRKTKEKLNSFLNQGKVGAYESKEKGIGGTVKRIDGGKGKGKGKLEITVGSSDSE